MRQLRGAASLATVRRRGIRGLCPSGLRSAYGGFQRGTRGRCAAGGHRQATAPPKGAPFTDKSSQLLLGRWVGYGYRTWRAVGALLAIVVIGAFVFHSAFPKHMRAIRPASQLPHFQAWLYSTDAVLPVINLGQKSAWTPTGAAQFCTSSACSPAGCSASASSHTSPPSCSASNPPDRREVIGHVPEGQFWAVSVRRPMTKSASADRSIQPSGANMNCRPTAERRGGPRRGARSGCRPETEGFPDAAPEFEVPCTQPPSGRLASGNVSGNQRPGRAWRPRLLGRSRAWRDVFLPSTAGPGPTGPEVRGQPGAGRRTVDSTALVITLLIVLLVVIDQVVRR